MNDDSKFTSTQPKREFQCVALSRAVVLAFRISTAFWTRRREWTPSTPSSRPCFTLPASLIGAS
eukprot:1789885-Prymnesium_polylepis.1